MAETQSVSGQTPSHQRAGWVTGTLVLFCLASTVVTVIAGLIQVSFGEYSMTFLEAWRAVFNPDVIFNVNAWSAFLFGTELPEMSTASIVVWELRLPRVFVGIITGATLAVSGAIFQAVTRNELASPFVLGVSSGAGFAVLATLIVFSGLASVLPLIATLGGAVAFILVYTIAWKGGTNPVRLVLAGVIVNMVFQSLQQGLFFFADDLGVVQTAIAWLTGSLTGTRWDQVRIALLPALFSIAIAIA